MNSILTSHLEKIESRISSLFCSDGEDYAVVIDAMKYSLAGGGKRVRPVLMMEFCRLCGLDPQNIIDFAVALECIHTYSLIHDDLPCMDNDDIRRGKPSCHITFSEAQALLAGDALLTEAFSLASGCVDVDSDRKLRAIKLLADNAGFNGMIGGQVIDLALEGASCSFEQLENMYLLKTGALLDSACKIGCILGGGNEEKINSAGIYAKNIGLAFQIVDDILDCEGSAEKLGKPIGSDEKNSKTTFVSLFGVDKCRKMVEDMTKTAIKSLEIFGDDAGSLIELANELAQRDH